MMNLSDDRRGSTKWTPRELQERRDIAETQELARRDAWQAVRMARLGKPAGLTAEECDRAEAWIVAASVEVES